MTPELVARVNAWLARRPGSTLARRWSALASTWADQRRSTLQYLVAPGVDVSGAEGSLVGDAEATASAMGGVLLALVREAWGCDAWRRLTVEPAGGEWCIVLRNGRHRPPSRAGASWELDAVAHPRYVSEMHSGPFGRNEFALEAEALVAALEAAPQREVQS